MPVHARNLKTPRSVRELDSELSEPRERTIAALARCPGDVMILGAGGKMGPTLALMVLRAAAASGPARRVVAVSRWSNSDAERALRDQGITTLTCDLLDSTAVQQLPRVPNVIFMAGQKFGTTTSPATTWGMNTLVPAYCCDHLRDSRIVAFSTGNVYPLTPVDAGGSRETDALGPVGEYAASCVGRERMLELASQRYGTRVAIIRLNYATELRYGVLVDIATRVSRGEPVSLGMGYVNVIWQRDANRVAIEALARADAPPYVLNLTGPRRLSVRETAEWFGRRLGETVVFSGAEGPDALLSNTGRMQQDFGAPEMSVDDMLEMTAQWVERGGELLGKPTKFEARDGRF
jgi:nucleoside-diphosphate-sugar epimerase